MNPRTFLKPLIEQLHDLLLNQIQSYAEYLGLPQIWLLQFLSTNISPDAKDAAGASALASAVLNHYLLSCGVEAPQPELAEHEDETEAVEHPLCASCSLGNLLATLSNYYDFYAALTWPEMLDQSDDWEAKTESGPYSKAAFKEYVRSTVAEEHHPYIFGETA